MYRMLPRYSPFLCSGSAATSSLALKGALNVIVSAAAGSVSSVSPAAAAMTLMGYF
jgi:hypothetical protein